MISAEMEKVGMGEGVNGLFEEALGLENRFEFRAARSVYERIRDGLSGQAESETAANRIAVLDELIREKETYQRIDENAKQVLTDIGVNISDNQRLMDILMEADAIDFESETAVFIPMKRDYIESRIGMNGQLPGDPGPNSFGTGATPPFLMRAGREDLKSASREEFERIVQTVGQYSDVVKIFSVPVATDKSISGFEAARLMEEHFSGFKMTATRGFSEQEMGFLKGKDHWVDGTSLITSLAPMGTMVEPFIRSAGSGANLLLLDLTIAGASGPLSPEALLTQIHAQVLFMMVLVQTLNPGVTCVHGGIPGVEANGDLSYSSNSQPMINAAMARVNQWITGFPSAQSGGSTSLPEVTDQAIEESARSRDVLRGYGVHVVRHALGALGNLNYFSEEKFILDCERERLSVKQFEQRPFKGIKPLYFPEDPESMDGIREIAEKGNPKYADHTLRNVDAFMKWEKTIKLKGDAS